MMRFASTGGERTIEELVERLYRIEGKGAAGVTRRARKELRDLNPQLDEIAEVEEGTTILVPDIEGAEPGGEGVPPTRAAADVVAADAEAAFAAAVEHLGRSIAEEQEDARRSVKLLRSRELKAAARDVPGAADHMQSALAGAQERLDDMEALELYRRMLPKRSPYTG